MNKLGIAFIGAGDIADLHAKAVGGLESADLAGIYDIDPDKCRKKADIYGCHAFSTIEDLLHSKSVDAVFVLTNMETHKDIAVKAAEAGKDILIEKPTASSVDEIHEIISAVNKAGVKAMPVHNYIYEPALNRAKAMLEAGDLGELVQLYVLYNIHHPETVAARYPGVIKHILTHHSYIMLYLAGKPLSVTAMKTTVNDGTVSQENVGMALFQMPCGALTHFCASFANDDHSGDPWTCMVKVIGTKGATRFSYRDWVINTPATVHSQTYAAYDFSIESIDRYFVEEVLKKNKPPLSTLDDAVTCQKIIEACEASIEERRHIPIN